MYHTSHEKNIYILFVYFLGNLGGIFVCVLGWFFFFFAF